MSGCSICYGAARHTVGFGQAARWPEAKAPTVKPMRLVSDIAWPSHRLPRRKSDESSQ